MLQKGIIETIEDTYTVKVRIPKYDKLESSLGGTRTEDLSTGIICALPGMSITYAVGDIVLVDFENDELSKPVVLGLLYRDHTSQGVLSIKGVDSSLDSINEKLSTIEGLQLYTHFKYSNDGGMTFTSLYDPNNVKENDDYSISSMEEISINPNISAIYWSIINENNIDIANELQIVTYLHGENPLKELVLDETYTNEVNIQVPFEFKACSSMTLRFDISLSKEEADKYYICLATDLDSIGSVYGDYIGISVSHSKTPSVNTVDYSWSSITNRNNAQLEQVKNSLAERIKANELDLRGTSVDEPENDETIQNSLLDAIEVDPASVIIGLNRNIISFGDGSKYIDTKNSSLHIESVVQKEFEIKRTRINDIPHLTVTLIDLD